MLAIGTESTNVEIVRERHWLGIWKILTRGGGGISGGSDNLGEMNRRNLVIG